MVVRKLTLLALILLNACAVAPTPPVLRIALLAPFEGRYREVGYQALYAARLAFQDASAKNIELLPLDDGSTRENAIWRARGLAGDSLVQAVIVLGYDATSAEVQAAFADLPLIITGNWTAQRSGETVFILANADLNTHIDAPAFIDIIDAATLPAPVLGGEIFALPQFPKLRTQLEGITILSSGAIPDEAFTRRYQNSDTFAPTPGLLASLTYDAVRIALEAVAESENREETASYIAAMEYEGSNGVIRFQGGYWQNAPFHRFVYNTSGELVTAAP